MHTIDTTTATPGLRLAKAIYSKDGRILAPAGGLVSAELLGALKRLNIAQITVNQAPSTVAAQPVRADDMLEAIKEIISHRFLFIPLANAQTKAVYDLAVERESRLQLSRPGKMPQQGSKPPPAFQTPKPPHVNMEAFIDATLTMGTLPIIFHKLVEIINSPYTSSTDAANVISTDPALAAKLLKLVNSAFYGLPSRIDTISRAVTLIGTGQLVMLAMGATLVTAFKGMPVSLISMQSFWTHSLACGVAARILALRLKCPQPESYFVAGLLHDIARLIVYSQLPEQALYLITEAKRQQVTVHSLEKSVLGFTHETLGAEMLKSWRCSEELTKRVATHHAAIKNGAKVEDAILPMADFLAHALNYGSSGEAIIPPISPENWNVLNISPQEIPDIALEMDEKIRELRSLFITE